MVREASLKQIMVQEKEAGMYALYCHEKKYEEWIAELLEREFYDVRVCSRWETFQTASRIATFSLVQVEELTTRSLTPKLLRLCSNPSLRPIYVLTMLTRNNILAAASLSIDGVIWLETMQEHLVPTLQSMQNKSLLLSFSEAVERTTNIPSQLREAITLACRSPSVLRNQTKLAKHVYCDRSTLTRQWGRFSKEGDPSLKTCLDWIALIRTVEARAYGMKWKDIQDSLRISRRSADRIALRLTDRNLAEWDISELWLAFSSSPVYNIIIERFASS